MTTQEVLDRHTACFGSGDLDGFLADYAPDCVLLTPDGQTLTGHEQLRPVFAGLFEEFGAPSTQFEMVACTVSGDVAYLVWRAKTAANHYALGTDTLLIRDGSIVAHTFAAHVMPASA